MHATYLHIQVIYLQNASANSNKSNKMQRLYEHVEVLSQRVVFV